jgi:hypothetical protein
VKAISRLLSGPRKAGASRAFGSAGPGPGFIGRERGSAPTAGLAGAALVAVLAVIGVAVIALLGQRTAGTYVARSHAEAAVAQVESCYATRHDYQQCALPALLSSAGLPVGIGVGQVSVSASSPTTYTVIATSSAPGPAGRGHATFTAFKDLSGIVRTCNRPGVGGCGAAGTW